MKGHWNGQEPNIRCFVAKSVLSRVTHALRGGSQKLANDDEGERGGSRYPPKNDDVIYEQPLRTPGQTIPPNFAFNFVHLWISAFVDLCICASADAPRILINMSPLLPHGDVGSVCIFTQICNRRDPRGGGGGDLLCAT